MNRRANQYVRPPTSLSLTVDKDLVPRFCLLTGRGFTISARTGCSVRDLLCGRLGISPEYLEKRIQTIFLNHAVVDDPDVAVVTAGSSIALSAAMPGIAGAMFRRGSPYAAMRSRISSAPRDADPPAARPTHVTVKLFNVLQGELGPAILGQGVQISGKALSDLFRRRPAAFRRGILSARIDGTSVDPRVALETDWTDQDVFLQVTS